MLHHILCCAMANRTWYHTWCGISTRAQKQPLLAGPTAVHQQPMASTSLLAAWHPLKAWSRSPQVAYTMLLFRMLAAGQAENLALLIGMVLLSGIPFLLCIGCECAVHHLWNNARP